MESIRIHHSTAARHGQNSMNYVTKLVATEHLRNKYSLKESALLLVSHVTCSSNFN